jgi:hypothetical protein
LPGPVPNHSDDLARPRERKGGGPNAAPISTGERRPVVIPRADPNWHKIAKMMWDAMKKSGQDDYYQQSDWAYAYSLCDDLTYYKNADRRSPEMLKAINTAMERLLLTEGDRRRARIELNEPEPETEPASVTAIADYKAELGLPEE